MNSASVLRTVLDLVGTANPTIATGAQIAFGAVELYRTMRDELTAPPDALTDEELAHELASRGLRLAVDNGHWLEAHGFPAKV